MSKIIISPFSRRTHITHSSTAKDYLFWPELIEQLNKEYETIQIAVSGETSLNCKKRFDNLNFDQLKTLLKESKTFISVDNFFPHFANFYGYHGIVIFTKSDPEIFGYKDNINLLKDKKYLRKNQFDFWEGESIDIYSNISIQEILKNVEKLCKNS